jgi:hypothetical protein
MSSDLLSLAVAEGDLSPFRALVCLRGAFPLSARPSPRALFIDALGLVGLAGGPPPASFIVPRTVRR